MNIIHINSSDISGGAARAAYRIHKSLLSNKKKYNIESTMRVMKKDSDDFTVVGRPPLNKSKFFIRSLPYLAKISRFGFSTENPILHSTAPFRSGLCHELKKRFKKNRNEIVHLHWLGDNTLSIEEIGEIPQRIVWTLHDFWPFCGAEHYLHYDLKNMILSDERYKNGYTKNNKSYFDKGRDINKKTWLRKKRHWQKKIDIVCPSKWMYESAKQSLLMKDWDLNIIPHPIDLNEWLPVEKKLARKILNLKANKVYILFNAFGVTSDPRKGSNLLFKAILHLHSLIKSPLLKKIEILVFGQSSPKNVPKLGFPIKYFGRLNDEISLRLIYSAADLMVAPSIQEAFGLTASESQACGTPVVAFGSSGLMDVIDHEVTGHLANPFDYLSLANSIKWVLENSSELKLGINARKRAESLWDSTIIAKQYYDLYSSK